MFSQHKFLAKQDLRGIRIKAIGADNQMKNLVSLGFLLLKLRSLSSVWNILRTCA
ncbi:MAG: hypothetical protein JETT_2084 [Candidatus Jettenia ecosi]|uniref:Uncharacterized protein n=1 Tax=Candidatus Jettenia ecosi TaxID=2494326 RepID=A0A533QAD2_9BACT|nr:MAG: hypothetical protein JETT_2084 [Candidatus Jettenia ecosi]